MPLSLYFDEDKRRIYEVPDSSSFITDGSGYRIYTPIDIPSAETKVVINTTFLWSRFVDFHNSEKWTTLAFSKTGGAFRYNDENGLPIYAAFDLRLINLWQFVPANYDHNFLINGNALEELTLEEFFDTTRITANVSPRINSADSLQTVVIETNALSNSLDYGGVLHYDETNIGPGRGTGIEHPIGTGANPVNNIEDGIIIATNEYLREVHTYSDVQLDRDVEGWRIRGFMPNITLFTNGFKVHNSRITDIRLSGDFNDSYIEARRTPIDQALNVYGEINNSFHVGTIKISANQNLNMADCESGIPGFESPVIDMNEGANTSFSSRAFSGGQTIINCDTPDSKATLQFIGGGKPHLEPSNTDGLLSARGSGTMDDRSAGTTVDLTAWQEVGVGGPGTWTEDEKQRSLAYSKKASDQAEQGLYYSKDTNSKL